VGEAGEIIPGEMAGTNRAAVSDGARFEGNFLISAALISGHASRSWKQGRDLTRTQVASAQSWRAMKACRQTLLFVRKRRLWLLRTIRGIVIAEMTCQL